MFNMALLSRWLWRFAYGRDRLWRVVIVAKYGCERERLTVLVFGDSLAKVGVTLVSMSDFWWATEEGSVFGMIFGVAINLCLLSF